MSISALARRSGVAKSTLSELESGRGNPTLSTLNELARAVGQTAAEFVGGPQGPLVVGVVRSDDTGRPQANREPLDGFRAEGHVEIYRLEYQDGDQGRCDAHGSGTIEHVLVHEGRLRVGPESDVRELRVGESITYRGDVPHVLGAIDGRAAGHLVVAYPAPRDGQAGSHGRAQHPSPSG